MNRERRVEVKHEKIDLWGGFSEVHILTDDGVVFADSLAYGDGQQIALHGLNLDHHHHPHPHDLLDKHHHSHAGRNNCSPTSSSASYSGNESCGRESTTSSRRVRNETLDQRLERLRKNAERGKLRRMEETEEQRQRRLARNAERGKLRRMEESQSKREERLRKNAERQKARRSKESPDERKLRLWKNAERQRIRRNSLPSTMLVDGKTDFEDYTHHEHLL